MTAGADRWELRSKESNRHRRARAREGRGHACPWQKGAGERCAPQQLQESLTCPCGPRRVQRPELKNSMQIGRVSSALMMGSGPLPYRVPYVGFPKRPKPVVGSYSVSSRSGGAMNFGTTGTAICSGIVPSGRAWCWYRQFERWHRPLRKSWHTCIAHARARLPESETRGPPRQTCCTRSPKQTNDGRPRHSWLCYRWSCKVCRLRTVDTCST